MKVTKHCRGCSHPTICKDHGCAAREAEYRIKGTPQPDAVGDWSIDHSAGTPILVYQNCSVIEAEQALYVLRLIAKDVEKWATPPDRVPLYSHDADTC